MKKIILSLIIFVTTSSAFSGQVATVVMPVGKIDVNAYTVTLVVPASPQGIDYNIPNGISGGVACKTPSSIVFKNSSTMLDLEDRVLAVALAAKMSGTKVQILIDTSACEFGPGGPFRKGIAIYMQ